MKNVVLTLLISGIFAYTSAQDKGTTSGSKGEPIHASVGKLRLSHSATTSEPPAPPTNVSATIDGRPATVSGRGGIVGWIESTHSGNENSGTESSKTAQPLKDGVRRNTKESGQLIGTATVTLTGVAEFSMDVTPLANGGVTVTPTVTLTRIDIVGSSLTGDPTLKARALDEVRKATQALERKTMTLDLAEVGLIPSGLDKEFPFTFFGTQKALKVRITTVASAARLNPKIDASRESYTRKSRRP